MNIPDNLLYTKDHEWILVDGDTATVGISDHAQTALGDITFVEPPTPDLEVSVGDEVCSIESCKAAASVYAPVAGTVVEFNEALDDRPELVNESPYDKGWLFTVEPVSLRKNLKSLYFGEDAHRYIHEERDKLFAMANQDLQIAADGGESAEDIFEEMEGDDWAGFAKKFFKT